MTWLDGWERIEIPGRPGGNYTGDEPWRCVLHSTEGLSVASAVGAYTTAGVPSTVTIGIAERRKVQHVDTDRSAYAVMNQPGGVETNRWRCIQAEIVMFADQAKAQQYGGLYVGDLTDDDYTFLRGALLELQADKPFTFDGPPFIRYPDSYGNTRWRMSFAEWEAFGGTCGHMHVPENDHGDPGELDRDRLFPSSLQPAHRPPHPQEYDMTPEVVVDADGREWVLYVDPNRDLRAVVDKVDVPFALGGKWSSGVSARLSGTNIVVVGRGTEAGVWELTFDPAHADKPPTLKRLGAGQIFPAA